jgi:hypothetical protein
MARFRSSSSQEVEVLRSRSGSQYRNLTSCARIERPVPGPMYPAKDGDCSIHAAVLGLFLVPVGHSASIRSNTLPRPLVFAEGPFLSPFPGHPGAFSVSLPGRLCYSGSTERTAPRFEVAAPAASGRSPVVVHQVAGIEG